MRRSEARELFSNVIKIECPQEECEAEAGVLCDTSTVWVHLVRYLEAVQLSLQDESPLIEAAALKKTRIVKNEENLGELFGVFSSAASNFYDTFRAFENVAMETGDVVSPPTIHDLYLELTRDIETLFANFDSFKAYYDKNKPVDAALGEEYERLVDSVRELNVAHSKFVIGYEKEIDNLTGEKGDGVKTLQRMAEHLRSMTEDYLRFSSEYNILKGTLLRRNLNQTFELFSEGFKPERH